ncbi:heme oxygenase (biliverdin-producing) [Nocardioides sp.]|uniref:biliverdin-producing heme oxygenase n=1 Tax=Nocardioides sp. TaxID=35761 RepID=UPI00271ED987|nr:biliverdin-producing heme oxygenase [Nocardioides sp.]MDO9456733.1 biliverdin-producing heme oxygenase [Nocardioides sp.]
MTITADTATATSLSTAMREGSKAEHEAAEGSSFMSELLEGALNEQAYADYLLRLRVVYAALEEAVRAHVADPMVAAVHDSALERLGAVDADLAHWVPDIDPATPAEAIGSPAATAYRDRIVAAADEASAGWGGALVAHHYTRYLGDLSGGQVIGRIMDRTFGLDGAGIAFYAFTEIPKPKPYKDAYRARLDGLGLDEAGVARVVDEVKVVFGLNQALFVELGANLPAYWRA